MKIKYIGSERYVETFGLSFKAGEVVDVTDEYAAEKLRFNPQFEAVDGKEKPKAGDKPKALTPGDDLKKTVEKSILDQSAKVTEQILKDIERKKKEG